MTHPLPTRAQQFKIDTRRFLFALSRAQKVQRCLMAAHTLPILSFEVVVIKVTGGQLQDRAPKDIESKGLITCEIEDALLAGDIDIAVCSMKDTPTLQPDALWLDCHLPGQDVRDGFVTMNGDGLMGLVQAAVVDSSNSRHRAHRRPDPQMIDFRDNVQTRMK